MKKNGGAIASRKRNRNAVKAKSSPSPRKNNMANSNIQNNSTTFETPNLLKSTSPKVNKYITKVQAHPQSDYKEKITITY